MKLSTNCRYGIRALLEIARHYGELPVKRKDIAYNQAISLSYLENILLMLKKSNIVDSIRGAHGGYVLTRSPDEINLLDVFRVLEGSLVPVSCLTDSLSCGRFDDCVTRTVWQELKIANEQVLQKTTIQELLNRENRSIVNEK
ncbi:MAG: Rrf2 family transcriptional regulator [Deltaproteobacteria bacterium]|nr:Rrf2 family transcriptional regulator [Candidatus Tharpella aukensis]